MSKPRPVYPGAVLFSTRRTHKRQFLLRPSREVNEAILYILGVLTRRHEIQLHALCGMSNHKHDVLSDPRGRVVEFERDCHALIARVINSLHGDFESLWSREPSCRVSCLEPEDVLDKIAYTMANPVEATLVAHGRSWPGVRLAWPMKSRTIRRPTFFRREELGGNWPEEAILEFHRPPGFDHLGDDELAALLRARIDAREQAARDAAQKAGTPFLGRRTVLAQSRRAYPSSTEERFSLRPTVACRSKWHRIARLQEDKLWLERYQHALASRRAGKPDALFPFGTWKLRVYYSLPCGPPLAVLHTAA